MGQDQSTGKRGQEAEAYGNVYVKTDQDTYLSDDTVTGTVHVQLRRPYPGDKICLKVKGKEFAKWIDKEHKQRQREDGTIEHYTVDVPREAEFVSVKHVVDIYDWHNGAVIPPGQFSFPISFKIPPGLPSSFFLRSGTTVAEVSYYVEAFLKPEKELYPKIKHKRPMTIRQALKNDITTKEVSINQEVSTCCCCSKGSVAMWTAFEKNAYAPGEEARIVTEVDNSKCELAVTNVRFELVQYIKLTAQNNAKALHFGIIGENLGRVEPGQAFVGEQRKEASIHLPPGIEGSYKAFKGDKQVQEYNLSPQQAISPSTNGTLVKSNFGLRVACGMDGCVCDTMPTTELPVTIYSIIQRKVADPSPPHGWNPTPMPASHVSIIISINGTAPVPISAGVSQPQANSLMSNSQMPPQPNNYQPAPQQPQPQYQQQQLQTQPQYQQQQQSQANYLQQSQQPLSNRLQESQYPQQPQYQRHLEQAQYQQPPLSNRQQESPLRQQESQYQRQQESPTRQQESQYRQQESPTRLQESQYQRQQPQSQSQIQSKPQYQQPQSQSQIQPKPQYQQQPQTQYQQESQYRQQESPSRLQESHYRQQASPSRLQESQYRQQESPSRLQESQYQRQQEPQYQQSQSQYRQQGQPQYQQQQQQKSYQTQGQYQQGGYNSQYGQSSKY